MVRPCVEVAGPHQVSIVSKIQPLVVGRAHEPTVNLAARLRYIAGSERSTKRYLNMQQLRDQQMNAITT